VAEVYGKYEELMQERDRGITGTSRRRREGTKGTREGMRGVATCKNETEVQEVLHKE
jgi:hypothetical protein